MLKRFRRSRLFRWWCCCGTLPPKDAEEPQLSAEPSKADSESPPVEEHPLAPLLDDEIFLKKLLSHLVEDGLQECRLVSHAWKRICDQLPVRLRVKRRENVIKAADIFPNAKSLAFSGHWPEGWWRNDDVDETLIAKLSAMTHLKRLNLGQTLECGIPKPPEILFGSLRNVESLTVAAVASGFVEVALLSCIRRLANLKSLELPALRFDLFFDVEPLTELQKLESLVVAEGRLTRSDGRLTFPSAALRRLKLHPSRGSCFENVKRIREGLRLYGPTLRSLDIGMSIASRLAAFDPRFLTAFPNLEHVHLPGRLEKDSCVSLKDLTKLTSLELHSSTTNVAEFASSLTSLKCLSLRGQSRSSSGSATEMPSLSSLVSSTQSAKRVPIDGPSLQRLTSLVSLKIILPGTIPSFIESLHNLKELEHLTIQPVWPSRVDISDSLTHLKKLKSLALYSNRSDASILHAAAALPDLTGLTLFYRLADSRPCMFLTEISGLTRLEELAISVKHRVRRVSSATHLIRPIPSNASELCEFISASGLQRLKYLTVWCHGDPLEETRQSLYQTFPTLRRIRNRDALGTGFYEPN